jgi:hypothetical protein
MKIREIILEDDSGTSADSGHPGGRGKSGKLHDTHKKAIKGMSTYPELPGWYYDMYRFGVHMAGSPDNQPMAQKSATANQLNTYAYTDAEEKIINKSKKEMGLKGKTLTSKKSEEMPDTHKVSPVAQHKKNKYGI